MSGREDYIEVPERIQAFMEAHPEGSLQVVSRELVELPGNMGWWWIVEAHAYRTPDDQRPGVGLAQEAVPGRTSFTKGSELMNAETSAWGRAMAALGIATKKGIATGHEVRAAQHRQEYAQTRPVARTEPDPSEDPYYDPEPPPVTGGAPAMSEFSGNMAATAKQLGAIRGMAQTLGVGSVKAGEFAHWVVNQRDGNDLPDGYLLTKADASYVIEQLKANGRDLADQWQA